MRNVIVRRKKDILFILVVIICSQFTTSAQYDSKTDAYLHDSIVMKNDTIRYHVYANGNAKQKKNILLFFHGSGPFPLFSKTVIYDTIQILEDGVPKHKIQQSLSMGSCVPFDLDRIPEDYLFVIISKKGVPFLDVDNTHVPGGSFFENEGLNYRVWQGDKVLEDLAKKWVKKPSKVVIIGHSEGSDVVAKLGHVNKRVTHVGYWAGGANTQYYDFALFIQKEVQSGKMSQADASLALDSLFIQIKNIENDPLNTKKQWLGNSYRRWSHFAEPSIDNLLKINKPIFVAVAGKDGSVPIESSLLIPIEFIRHKKDNLTFKLYPNYNHSFAIAPQDETNEWRWEFMVVFEEFMNWVEIAK
jgi:esterase/lipase